MSKASDKACVRCGQEKPLTDFERNRKRASGFGSHCAPCATLRNRDRYLQQRDDPDYRARHNQYAKNYHKRHGGKAPRKSNPLRDRARWRLSQAVYRGAIVKPTKCEGCAAELAAEKIHGHHDDYNKPFDVRWLCRICHGLAHRRLP